MVRCKLPVGPDRSQLPENCCRESFGNCLPASVRRPPWLANIKGRPTKRIVRTLTTESSGGNRPTYEKELLNSRKNSHFYKTNHPGFPHVLPPMTQMTTFFAYMLGMTGVAGDLAMTRRWGEDSSDPIPIRPTTNQVLCPQNTLRRFFTAQKGGMCGAPNRRCTFLTFVQSL